MDNVFIDNHLFSELNIQLQDPSIIFFKSFIEQSENWIWKSTNLHLTAMSNEDLISNDFGNALNDFIKEFRSTMTILKVPPFSHVPWHIDINPCRRCVINVPIMIYPKSLTFVTTAELKIGEVIGDEYTTYKIPYELKKLYLLNSQKYHSVFNFDNNPRYVISFCSEFITYPEALMYFKNKNLVNRSW